MSPNRASRTDESGLSFSMSCTRERLATPYRRGMQDHSSEEIHYFSPFYLGIEKKTDRYGPDCG